MDKWVKIKSNGGIRKASVMANFGSFPVWYDKGGTANILSLKAVKDKFRVTYSSKNEGVFCVHTLHGIVEFHPHTNGLQYTIIDAIKKQMKMHHHI